MASQELSVESGTSVSVLTEDIEGLRKRLTQYEKKIEEQSQEVHGLRSQVNLFNVMQNDYLSEIDLLQQDKVQREASYEAALQHLKKTHADKQLDLQNKVECLEAQLADQQASYATELSELKETGKESKDFEVNQLIESLRTGLREAQNELEDSCLAHKQTQELYHLLDKEKNDLVCELQNAKEVSEITQEKLNIAKSDISNLAETMEELRATLTDTQNELASYKLKPTDSDARGNSLFAEVEDKRQAMLKRMKTITSKYTLMKNDYFSKCKEISKLKLEKAKQCQMWKDELEKQEQAEVWLSDNYQIRIKELQDDISYLKSIEKPVFVDGDTKILKYADHVVEQSRKELEKLREEMEWRSAQRLNEAEALFTERRNTRVLRTRVMALEAEVQLLQDQLKQLNVPNLFSPGKQVSTFVSDYFFKETERSSSDQLQIDNQSEALHSTRSQDSNSVNSGMQLPLPPELPYKAEGNLDISPPQICLNGQPLKDKPKETSKAIAFKNESLKCLTDLESSEYPMSTIQHEATTMCKLQKNILVDFETEALDTNVIYVSSTGSLNSQSLLETSEGLSAFNCLSEGCDAKVLKSIESACTPIPLETSELVSAIKIQKDAGISVQNMQLKKISTPIIEQSSRVCAGVQRSILANAVNKSSLATVENVKPTRKVCFDVSEGTKYVLNKGNENIKTENVSKKTLTRTNPHVSYKTNFIVSKENLSP